MTASWFNGIGAFNEEELEAFLKDYKSMGKHDWQTEIDLGREVSPNIQNLVNQVTQEMGRLQDRLALTLVELNKTRSEHAGNCSIYVSLSNESPNSGICTCSYGLHVMKTTGKDYELYSSEIRERLIFVGEGI